MAERRFLCVAHRFPLPVDDGSSLRVLGMLGVLARLGEVLVAVPPRPDTTPDTVAELTRRTGAAVVSDLAPTRPHPGGPRIWPRSLCTRTPPWFVMWFDEAVCAAAAKRLDWATHLVALDDFAAQYLLHLSRPARVVLDKHKVYAAPAARGEPPSGHAARLRDAALRALVRANEARTLRTADVVFVTSEEEDRRLRAIYGTSATAVVPSAVETPALVWQPGKTRRVVWVGTADSRPNRDGLVRFFAAMRRRPASFELVVAGRGVDADLRASATGLAVSFLGYVADLEPVIASCDAAVLPLWAGGGGRLKTLTLLGSGIPVVATPAALEGLDLTDGRHCVVADDPDALVERLEWVLGPGRDAAAAMGRRAHELVRDAHTWAARVAIVAAALEVTDKA